MGRKTERFIKSLACVKGKVEILQSKILPDLDADQTRTIEGRQRHT